MFVPNWQMYLENKGHVTDGTTSARLPAHDRIEREVIAGGRHWPGMKSKQAYLLSYCSAAVSLFAHWTVPWIDAGRQRWHDHTKSKQAYLLSKLQCNSTSVCTVLCIQTNMWVTALRRILWWREIGRLLFEQYIHMKYEIVTFWIWKQKKKDAWLRISVQELCCLMCSIFVKCNCTTDC